MLYKHFVTATPEKVHKYRFIYRLHLSPPICEERMNSRYKNMMIFFPVSFFRSRVMPAGSRTKDLLVTGPDAVYH